MKKYCIVLEIKEAFQDEYIKIHKKAWREMLKAIRESGIMSEVIYFYKNQSIVFIECNDYEASYAKLRASEIGKKWDKTVCPWFKENPARAFKIFDLNQQLDGKLLPD